MTSDVADDLTEALVGAYLPFVESRVRARHLEIPAAFERALEEGIIWLRSTLEELLELPYAQQRRGPLEVFQEAMRFPTRALVAAGAQPVARDAGAVAALPGDLFDLAPASPRQISEAAWLAHLAWGAAKARSMQRSRRVIVLARNLMDRARIESVVTGSGDEFSPWRPSSHLEDPLPDLLVVDLEHEEAPDVIASFAATGIRMVAFGPHARRELLDRARRAGCEVSVRSDFFNDVSRLVT